MPKFFCDKWSTLVKKNIVLNVDTLLLHLFIKKMWLCTWMVREIHWNFWYLIFNITFFFTLSEEKILWAFFLLLIKLFCFNACFRVVLRWLLKIFFFSFNDRNCLTYFAIHLKIFKHNYLKDFYSTVFFFFFFSPPQINYVLSNKEFFYSGWFFFFFILVCHETDIIINNFGSIF